MKTLLAEDQIRARVKSLADELSSSLAGREVVVIGVLTGCLMFLADLVRHLEMPLRIGFVQARSYRGVATSPGTLEYSLQSLPEVEGRHVVLVDDIFDSGQTLDRLVTEIAARSPASLTSIVLLAKEVPRETPFEPDLVGFKIPAQFVVGYGLDHDGRHRNLPYIAVLEEFGQIPTGQAGGDAAS